GHSPSEIGQTVIAPPFVVINRTLVEFLNESITQESLDNRVKRTRAEPDLSLRPVFDFFKDGVAVHIAISDGEPDMEDRRCQRQVCFNIGIFLWHCSSGKLWRYTL